MAPDEKDPEDFASLLAEYDAKRGVTNTKKKKEPRPGDEVRGRIVSIGRDAVFIELGGKSDGVLDIAEVRDADGKLTVAVGDEIEARVVDAGGPAGVVLRRTLGRGPDARGELAQAFEHQIPVEGLVSGVNKGGVEVQVAGVRAFCPISQLDLRHVVDASVFVGQKLQFRITKFEAGGRNLNLVLSRRALLEEEASQKAAATRATLAVGQVVRGKVTTLKDYGAFVDLGGLEGMLHVSELGFQRVSHPKELLTVGQAVEVQIVKMEKSDDPKRPEKISLSLKSLERDPWSDVVERFPEGVRLRGKVVKVESFGAFVELAPGVEGLLHVSEMAGEKRGMRDARQGAKVGDTVEVTVMSIDRERRRISLTPAVAGEENEAPMAREPAPKLGTFADLLNKGKKKK
jgi:small subunit ribosomal protein S1